MTYVLGIDSSTQSCKAVLVDAASGEIVDQARASHPGGTQVDPAEWIAALDKATDGLLKKADAVAVAGQQHGMVAQIGRASCRERVEMAVVVVSLTKEQVGGAIGEEVTMVSASAGVQR